MRATLCSFVFVFAVGCASSQPRRSLEASIASVKTAEELGASQVPQAERVLKYAKKEIAWTRALIANRQNERAQRMAQRAESDAALAIALVREQEARRAAEAAGKATPNP